MADEKTYHVQVHNAAKGPRYFNHSAGQTLLRPDETSAPFHATEAEARSIEETDGLEVQRADERREKPLGKMNKTELADIAEREGVDTVLVGDEVKPFAEGSAEDMRKAIEAKRAAA